MYVLLGSKVCMHAVEPTDYPLLSSPFLLHLMPLFCSSSFLFTHTKDLSSSSSSSFLYKAITAATRAASPTPAAASTLDPAPGAGSSVAPASPPSELVSVGLSPPLPPSVAVDVICVVMVVGSPALFVPVDVVMVQLPPLLPPLVVGSLRVAVVVSPSWFVVVTVPPLVIHGSVTDADRSSELVTVAVAVTDGSVMEMSVESVSVSGTDVTSVPEKDGSVTVADVTMAVSVGPSTGRETWMIYELVCLFVCLFCLR